MTGSIIPMVNRNTLRDQIFAHHFNQRTAFDIFRVAASGKPFGIEIRRALQLRDALGNSVGMCLLLLGKVAVPCASLGLLLMGPGASITHAAIHNDEPSPHAWG